MYVIQHAPKFNIIVLVQTVVILWNFCLDIAISQYFIESMEPSFDHGKFTVWSNTYHISKILL